MDNVQKVCHQGLFPKTKFHRHKPSEIIPVYTDTHEELINTKRTVTGC
jgi:hypothetical protein